MKLLTWLVKFVAIPGALAAFGFFYVGPRLGGDVAKRLNQSHAQLEKTLEKLTPPTEKTKPTATKPAAR
ncbi:MAG: hypothetical protein ACOYON_03755 [Fimbriimonas sp.]